MINFNDFSTAQLVQFYNRHAATPVSRFSDRSAAVRRCEKLYDSLKTEDSVKVFKQREDVVEVSAPALKRVKPVPVEPEVSDAAEVDTVEVLRPNMRDSLKLDRTITCVETGETWKNAHRMWLSHPDWMTSGQQDRLTAQLYGAAKVGEQKTVEINGRNFKLVNV